MGTAYRGMVRGDPADDLGAFSNKKARIRFIIVKQLALGEPGINIQLRSRQICDLSYIWHNRPSSFLMEILYGPGSGMSNAGRITGCHGKLTSYFFHKIISTHLLIMEVDFCPVLCIPEVPVLQAFRGISHFVWYCKAVSDLS